MARTRRKFPTPKIEEDIKKAVNSMDRTITHHALVEKAYLKRMLNLIIDKSPSLCLAALADVQYEHGNGYEIQIKNPST